MKTLPKLSLLILLVITSISLITVHYMKKIPLFYVVSTILYTLILLYHFIIDRERNRFFITVISLFLISSISTSLCLYFFMGQVTFIYISYTLNLIAYFVLFIEIIKENKSNWEINRNILFVPIIIGVTVFLSSQIVGLISSYKLRDFHVWYVYLFTILKLVFLSLGIIFYLLSKNNYKHIALLNWSITFFLFRDIAEIVNYLPILKTPLRVFFVLEDIVLLSALISFYLYCSSPKKLKALEVEPIE